MITLLFDRRLHTAFGKKTEVQSAVQAVLQDLAALVSARVLLPPWVAAQPTLSAVGVDAFGSYYGLIETVIGGMDRETIATHYKQLFRFLLAAFDMRLQLLNTYEESNDMDGVVDEVDANDA